MHKVNYIVQVKTFYNTVDDNSKLVIEYALTKMNKFLETIPGECYINHEIITHSNKPHLQLTYKKLIK